MNLVEPESVVIQNPDGSYVVGENKESEPRHRTNLTQNQLYNLKAQMDANKSYITEMTSMNEFMSTEINDMLRENEQLSEQVTFYQVELSRNVLSRFYNNVDRTVYNQRIQRLNNIIRQKETLMNRFRNTIDENNSVIRELLMDIDQIDAQFVPYTIATENPLPPANHIPQQNPATVYTL